MKLFSTVEVAKACTTACEKTVGETFVLKVWKAIHKVAYVGTGHKILLRFDERQFIIAYTMDAHRRLGRPDPIKWAEQTKRVIPKQHRPSLPTVISPVKKIADESLADSKRLVTMEKQIVALTKKVSGLEAASPHTQIGAPVIRKNDPRIEAIHKKVNAFVFNEPACVKDTWNRLRRDFEIRNGIRVLLQGDQTFPDWLRSSGNLDVFVAEYQGFLDAYHDELNHPTLPPPSPHSAQKELGL